MSEPGGRRRAGTGSMDEVAASRREQEARTRAGSVESSGADPAEAGSAEASPTGAAHAATPPSTRRTWWWALAAVLVVVGVVVAILVVTNERQPPRTASTLPAEVVTLPVPTPTVDPVELPEGTAFFEALPRTVLQFAVTEAAAAPAALQAGALEAYRLVYDDGSGTGLTLLASQWRTPEGAAGRFSDVLAEQSAQAGTEPTPPASTEGAASEGDTEGDEATASGEDPATRPRLEQGPVVVAGAEVGSYLLRVREDGTATVWWTNTTAFFSLDGPAEVLRDVYAAFPL